jgi:sugar-specific transcriptional regulator TrmB
VVKKVKNLELQKALETMGFTEYEAKAYLNLVQIGTSNAGNLSKASEIPHSKIYEVLIRLEKKRLIEVQKGRPFFFKAFKPSLSLARIETDLKSNLQQELTQRKKDLERLCEKKTSQIAQAHIALTELDNFYEKNDAIEPSEEFIWTIRGKDNVTSQAKETILSAASEVRLMMPVDDFSELVSAIRMAASKGVKIQLVIHELTASVEKLKDSAEIFHDQSPLPTNCGMIVSDLKRGMFISENSTIGFKASSKSVLMVLAQFYQHEKEESAKIKWA